MKAKLFLPLLCVVLLFSRCGSSTRGNEMNGRGESFVTVDMDLHSFSSISATSGWDVYVVQGDRPSVRLEISEGLKERIKVRESRGVLELGMSSRSVSFSSIFKEKKNKHLRAYVTVRELKSLNCGGGVDVRFDSPISQPGELKVQASGGCDIIGFQVSCDRLSLDASGGSDVEIRLLNHAEVDLHSSGGSDVDVKGIDADKVTIEGSGGSDVLVEGKTRELFITASGGSDVDGAGLKSVVCHVQCSGAADAKVHVSDYLKAQASGASDIICFGAPRRVDNNSSGASSIRVR